MLRHRFDGLMQKRRNSIANTLELRLSFIGLGKDNCKTRREAFKFDVRLILEILRYIHFSSE